MPGGLGAVAECPGRKRGGSGSAGSGQAGAEAAAGAAVALPPVLMNKQDRTAVCLGNMRGKHAFSRPLGISTVGAPLPRPLRGLCLAQSNLLWRTSDWRLTVRDLPCQDAPSHAVSPTMLDASNREALHCFDGELGLQVALCPNHFQNHRCHCS